MSVFTGSAQSSFEREVRTSADSWKRLAERNLSHGRAARNCGIGGVGDRVFSRTRTARVSGATGGVGADGIGNRGCSRRSVWTRAAQPGAGRRNRRTPSGRVPAFRPISRASGIENILPAGKRPRVQGVARPIILRACRNPRDQPSTPRNCIRIELLHACFYERGRRRAFGDHSIRIAESRQTVLWP